MGLHGEMQGPDEDEPSTGPLGVELPLDPRSVAQRVDLLALPQLSRVGTRLLAALGQLSEAPGTKIHADSLHSQAPGSQPPAASPFCRCGCPSRAEHHHRAFGDALERAAASDPMDLSPLRGAILRASFDLSTATRSPDQPNRSTDPRTAEDSMERDERMLRDYEGWPPDAAAATETFRTGAYISGEAMRRMRRKNSADIESGRPLPPPDQLRKQAREMFVEEGMTKAAIARELGIGRSSVVRILAAPDPQAAKEAAA